MREHVIYYFSGTGNSLWTALNIKKALGDCSVVLMKATPQRPKAVKSMGFVFPCYFSGVPHNVLDFFKNLDAAEQDDTYYYAVVTYGLLLGSTLGQTHEALQERNIKLNYAAPLKSFANYVLAYNMSSKVAEKTAQTKRELQEIIPHIINRDTESIGKPSAVIMAYNKAFSKDPSNKDSKYLVNETCDGCGICIKVCPTQNVLLKEDRPHWLHHCVQCLACLQWCPKRAIDYGEKTRKRGRYTHPEITSRMFIDYLSGVGAGNSG
ncbi:MAG: EFR1 family ferrodoxin [Coriobacteriia bacterium]|nr:EFR1 family ferrodoxin [Coriobacteriia bacterium]MCL2750426.1 EFR1 family ferrodoxin [Coriobacteriia bacterium]